ncbi:MULTISPECIES: LacI family DNA-binding transcriptional regulator [unclassified Variovorax]|uniref:LacI family DNA-binding transcriptional regulator n=1 Tax=unclassified Variovorax TaxID=663243 RepID=UPI002578E971|nr:MULTISPECIES: LacI family DNA-binding transcriptional regulator [unclassified Variovorax]MDM0089315.1 LacI family DNA-binding transcriptional regulator [Variovorax sp. J22G40]MDM0147388.1 LacI family DNA-binding transcriptional regulator [Variovorax sp. J2P1-31]
MKNPKASPPPSPAEARPPAAVAERAPTRRPTQRDIAVATGMSQTAVSLVLNRVEPCTVSEEARQRILQTAQRLGYVPNRMARNLQSARTRTLACIVPDITNPIYPALVRGFQSAADAGGYDTMIFDTDGTAERERRALQWLAQGHVDGVMAIFFHLDDAALLEAVRGGLAMVQVTSQASKPSHAIDKVYVDNAAAARAMTQVLIDKGHERIAMLSCPMGPGKERQRGFQAAMKKAGLSPRIIVADDFTQAAGARAMAAELAGEFHCSAVFAANDLLAIGAMAALRTAGRRIPQDMALAGFDDIPAAQLLHPALTTVRRSEQTMGRFAADLLIARLDGPEANRPGRSFELPFQIVLRDST